MKIIYTLTLIMATLTGVSQIVIDSSDFAMIGDTFTIVVGKNPAIIDVKGGANATWDFSKLTVDSLTGAKVRAIDKSKYPIDSLFPDADLKITSHSYGESYLIKTKDSIVLDGLANLDLVQGNPGFTFNFNPNVKIMSFPMKYNDMFSSLTIIDTIVDTAITALSFDKIRIHIEFSFASEVEGYGKLITAQDTLDVLKLYSEEGRSFKIYGHHTIAGWLGTPFITQNDTLHNYRWFAKNVGYQVAEASADERNGTTVTASNLLTTKSLFAFISNSTMPKCYGSKDGDATVKAIGGTGTYSYKWSHSGSANGSTATNLAAGSYMATVTDIGSNKTFVTGLMLTEPDSLSTILISTKDEGPLPNTGEIEISVIGGTPAYAYAWDKSSSTTKIASDLAGGTHKISVTDKNGCQKDTSITIGSTVGIESYAMHKVNVFPNPVKTHLTISGLNAKADLFIIDITGKVALQKEINFNTGNIDVSDLENGLYFIKIKEENNTVSYRLIKE